MTSDVIGVFESVSVADEVVSELTRYGFSSSAVIRYRGSGGDLETQLQNAGVEAGDARNYAASVTREGALVVVQADEVKTDEAVAIMNRYYAAADSDEAPYTAGDTQTATGDSIFGIAKASSELASTAP